MKTKKWSLFFAMAVVVLFLSPPIYSASYAPGTFAGLEISASSDFAAGTYTITGNFIVDSGMVLTLKGPTTINVTGDVTITGTIATQSTSSCPVKITSSNGNITVNNSITVTSPVGIAGANGAAAQNGSPGAAGATSNLDIVADKGNIVINGVITNLGGAGGRGGNGGGSNGSDGGAGGTGGNGGDGGTISIIAKSGRIDVKKQIKSVGGAGGAGGTGGPDQSIFGGPGVGGNGGNGGKGGAINIVGQDVAVASTASFDVTPGTAGSGGAGGTGGTFGGSAASGANGTTGTAGSIALRGGEVLNDTGLISSFPGVTVTPTTATKIMQYDQASPANPSNFGVPYYMGIDGVYYANTTSPVVKILVPTDNGFQYTYNGVATTYKSDITRFKIYSREVDATTKLPLVNCIQNYTPGQADAQGYITVTLPVLQSSSTYNLNVITYDKYNNSIQKFSDTGTWLQLAIDLSASTPILSEPVVGGTNGTDLQLSWSTPADVSGISGYDVLANDVVRGMNQTATTFTYTGIWNEKVKFSVKAQDGAGNQAQSADKYGYTAAQSTSIKGVTVYKSPSNGYNADVTFTSVGGNAAGYDVKYYQVDLLGNRIGSDKIVNIGPIGTPAGQDFTYTIVGSGIQAHQTYKFFIDTYNRNPIPLYTNWAVFKIGTTDAIVTVPNTAPTVPNLQSPSNGQFVNTAVLKATASTDVDADTIQYTIFVGNDSYHVTPDTSNNLTLTVDLATIADGNFIWYVRAYDGYAETLSSKWNFNLDRVKPTKPAFSIANAMLNTRQVTLTNIAPLDGDVANLRISTDAGNAVLVTPATSATYTLPAVEGAYNIHLAALDRATNVSDESVVPVVYDITNPQIPTNITVVHNSNTVKVSWTASVDAPLQAGTATSGIDTYYLTYVKHGYTNWCPDIAISAPTTAYTLTGIEEGPSYDIKIRVKDKAGNLSDYSNVIIAQTSSLVNFTDPNTLVVVQGNSAQIGFTANVTGTATYYYVLPNGNNTTSTNINVDRAQVMQYIPFTQTTPGTYSLVLKMTDTLGNSNNIYKSIMVVARPTVKFNIASKQIVKGNQLVINTTDYTASDTNGNYINRYSWNFGDGQTVEMSAATNLTHLYNDVGDYTVTLTVTNNQGVPNSATLSVKVVNTRAGSLVTNESWNGTVVLAGDVIVPQGLTLTIQPGTVVKIPANKTITVDGTIVCSGTSLAGITFTAADSVGANGNNYWAGLSLTSNSKSSVFSYVTFEYAGRGLILNKQTLTIGNCTFSTNLIGLHMASSAVTVNGCTFRNNAYYGIKEEAGCTPQINNNKFIGNGVAPYYSYTRILLNVNTLNSSLGSNNQTQ